MHHERSRQNGIFQEIDGTKNKRDLTLIDAAAYVPIVPFTYACLIEAMHWNLRAPRKLIVKETLKMLPKPLSSLSDRIK